uniref:CARD domain-containing protein n=1 Tax=Plectus sambesii TaxID=2011161 RepID=A0A914WN49_9BILA
MKEEHLDLLDTHRFELVAKMDPDDMVDFLISAKVLTQRQAKDITSKPDTKTKNRALLDQLRESGENAFEALVEALTKTDRHALAKLLSVEDPIAPSLVKTDSDRDGAATGSGSDVGKKPFFTNEAAALNKLQNLNTTQLKDALNRQLFEICRSLMAQELCSYLVAYGTMTDYNRQVILTASRTQYEQNQELCSYLNKKDKSEILHFIDGLLATGQGNIACLIAGFKSQ